MLCTKLVILYVRSRTVYNHVDMVVQSTGLCVCTVSYDVAVFVAQSLGEVLVCHACYGGDVDAAQDTSLPASQAHQMQHNDQRTANCWTDQSRVGCRHLLLVDS